MSEHHPDSQQGIDRPATVFLVRGTQLSSAQGVVTRIEGPRVTIRTTATGGFSPGDECVLAVRMPAGVVRGRARVVSATDLAIGLKLAAPLGSSDRRASLRATVLARMLIRKDRPGREARVTGPLSVVPTDGVWLTEYVQLSPTGLRVPAAGRWAAGERAQIRLHFPGPAGGVHLVAAGEVIRFDIGVDGAEVAFQFEGLSPDARWKIMDVVDRARLAALASGS
jgi:hypothetical protein